MKTNRQIPGWIIFVLALAVALAAVVTIAMLRQHADESHQAETLLSRLETLSYQLDALEWRFERKPDPKILENVQAVENQIAQTLDELMRLDPGNERLQQISKVQLEFETSIDQTFRLIAAGDLEKADLLDKKQVDVNFEMLSGLITSASVAYSERAQQAQRASSIGTTFVIIVAGMIIGILSLQFQNIQVEAKLIAIEQDTLRKARDELEVRVQERTEELAKTNKTLKAEITERRRMEGEKDRLLKAMASSTEGIAITDEHDRYIYVNAAHAMIYGYSQEELIGKTWQELTIPEMITPTEKVLSDTLYNKDAGIFSKEIPGLKKDGTIIPTEIMATAIWDENGSYCGHICTAKDITDRNQIEKALRESEERYRNLFEDAPISLREEDSSQLKNYIDSLRNNGVKDFRKYFEDHPEDITHYAALVRIIDINKAALKLYGARSKDEFFNNLNQFFTEYSYNLFIEELIAIAEGKTMYESEDLVKTLTGDEVYISLRWYVAPGYERTYSKILISAIDITKRKLAEDSLKLFSEAVEEAPDGVQITDLEGHVIYSNKAVEEIYGLSPAQFKGKHVDEMNVDLGLASSVILPAIKETGRWAGELMVKHRNGHAFPIWLTASMVKDSRGKPIALMGIITDITERKQMEKELQERESFLTSIFTSIQDGIGIIDKDMNIIRTNPTVERWYPHAVPFAGKKCYEAYHNRSERCEICPAWRTLTTGESAYDVVPKSGPWGENIGWVEIYSFPMIDTTTGQTRGVIEYVRDITERKQAQMALEEAIVKAENEKNKSNAIIESIGDGIIIQDTDYKIIYQNKIQNDSFGDHVGEYCYKAYEGKDIICEDCPVELAFKDGKIHRSDRITMTDKGILYAELTGSPLRDSTGKIIAGIKVIRNITERKQIEEALRKAHDELEIRVQERTKELTSTNETLQAEITERERTEELLKQSEEKYHTLVDHIQDGVFIIQDAKVQFVNEALAMMSGYTVEELIGKDFREFIAPEDLEVIMDRYHRRIAGEDILREYEFNILHKDGKTRVLTNINIGLITYGGRVATMGTMKDITEKKKLEAQLLRAQRMESIGTLAGGIAHDLNNVLTPIMLSLQILQGKFPDEQSKMLIDLIETNTQRGANLIKQVMSFARGIEGERTTLQIADLISETKKILNETFPRYIKISTDLPEGLWSISGDATQLHQVLMNLCVNARDAMPDGGTLRISAKNIVIDENYTRMNIEAKVGSYIIIAISDDGTGIPPEIISRIFEPFFTTKEFGKGTGLGLSTSLGIVKGHGGFIDVYSEVGRGTTFKVYLPALKTIEVQKAQQEQQHELSEGHGELILIVDDETRILEITRATLEKFGYRVIIASNGAEAIKLYTQNMDEIKVVLMDMMMPVMDGIACIRALRNVNPQIKVIGISGLAEREKLSEGVDTHVHAFLSKPFTAKGLLKTIHDVLNL